MPLHHTHVKLWLAPAILPPTSLPKFGRRDMASSQMNTAEIEAMRSDQRRPRQADAVTEKLSRKGRYKSV